MSNVEGVAATARPARGGLAYLSSASWLGLVIGLVELGVLLIEKRRNHIASIGALRLNRHYPWMVPASQLLIFAGCGLALELFRRARPDLARRLAPKALGALTLLAIFLATGKLETIGSTLLACGIASQLIPRVGRFASAFRRVVRFSLPPLVGVLVLLIVGCHVQFAMAEQRAGAKRTARDLPNVLFITLDTVRAKSLGLYGYARDTSPNLGKLAARGVAFANARSAAPWTLPSHATMLTGRWPSELFDHPEQKLPDNVPTLAEYLGRNGYATGGFVANTFYCNAGFGLGRGFDHYEDFYEDFDTSPAEVLRHSGLGRRLIELVVNEESIRPDGRKDADRINGDFLAWQSGRQGRPFFAFLNYLDAHAPYIPPPSADRHFGLRPTTPADFQLLATWQKLTVPPTDPREIELARDAYDDCIAYLDGALGRLFAELGRRGELDSTLVVVTADHGEEIGEHQLVGHGRSLYREELHVPLLIAKPGRLPSARIVYEPVSLRNLPATIVDILGLSARSPFPGRSLTPLWAGSPGDGGQSPGLVRSEVSLRDKAPRITQQPPALQGPMISIIAEGYSYIRNAHGIEELYQLNEDQAEARDLAGDDVSLPILERLRALADRQAVLPRPGGSALADR